MNFLRVCSESLDLLFQTSQTQLQLIPVFSDLFTGSLLNNQIHGDTIISLQFDHILLNIISSFSLLNTFITLSLQFDHILLTIISSFSVLNTLSHYHYNCSTFSLPLHNSLWTILQHFPRLRFPHTPTYLRKSNLPQKTPTYLLRKLQPTPRNQ